MATALLASEVPSPPVPSTAYWLSDALNNGDLPPQSAGFAELTYSTSAMARFNALGMRVDLQARYGGGGNCKVYGLVVSLTSGLGISVTAGQAYVNAGIVEKPATFTHSVTAYGAAHRVHLWLKADGSIGETDNVTTTPAYQAVYLGSVLINGSNNALSSFDDAGVMWLVNGVMQRTTADTDTPTDTPNANLRFFNFTTSGLTFFWDGTQYVEMIRSGRTPRVRKITLSYTALSTAGLTAATTIYNLPAGGVYRHTKQKTSQAFTGGAVTAATIEIGIVGNTTKYASAYDVFAAVAATNMQSSFNTGVESHGAATAIVATLKTLGANTSALTAGSVEIWIENTVEV